MEEIENKDQAPEDTQVKEPAGPVTLKKEQATKGQSETTKESEQKVSESKLYKLPDGREVTADDLYKEHTEKLLPEFTRRSQKLSEFEKKAAEMETRAEEIANKAVDENELLKNVDPNVKSVIGNIALDTLKSYLKEQEEIKAREAKSAEWENRFRAAQEKHNGKDGNPVFEKDAMLKFMMEKEIYDPDEAYYAFNREKIEDNLIKKALMNKGAPITTETTGGDAPKKPQGKSPKTFEEAAKSAYERLKNS